MQGYNVSSVGFSLCGKIPHQPTSANGGHTRQVCSARLPQTKPLEFGRGSKYFFVTTWSSAEIAREVSPHRSSTLLTPLSVLHCCRALTALGCAPRTFWHAKHLEWPRRGLQELAKKASYKTMGNPAKASVAVLKLYDDRVVRYVSISENPPRLAEVQTLQPYNIRTNASMPGPCVETQNSPSMPFGRCTDGRNLATRKHGHGEGCA